MLHFYRDLLGCQIERQVEEIDLIQLRAGRSQIDLIPAVRGDSQGADQSAYQSPDQPGGNVEHFCLAIDPFNESELRAYLEQHGVNTEPAQTRFGADGYGPSIYINDPQGNVVELKGPPAAG